ncbi:probable WRKY transcription factor 53 [Papaver somniferum]|uniref:probable WRKY transcription factor 53 n=1 Tax=Papaver somniferum TaxID=3469 RepID=UPI000E6F7A05|nr:probable WRKY transcription factor 53 [Papaver somniferum]
MERKDDDWDQRPLMELTQAKGLVEQLQTHVMDSPSATTNGKELMTKITSSYKASLSMLNGVKFEDGANSLSMLKGIKYLEGGEPSLSKLNRIKLETGENSLSMLSGVQGGDPPKMTGSSTTAIIPTDSPRSPCGSLGNHDDSNLVRKQSKIRCAHRVAQGCLSNKQVQRSDEDPSIFDVTYQGLHTCNQVSHLLPGQPPNKEDQKLKNPQETLLNFKTGCHVKVEDFISLIEPKSTSFSLPSASTPNPNSSKREKKTVVPELEPHNHSMDSRFHPPSASPTTSNSSFFSPYQTNNFGELQNLQSDHDDFATVTASGISSPSQDFGLDFFVDFNSDIPFSR